MAQCECESCSLEACINQENSLLGFLNGNGSWIFEYEELYVTGGGGVRILKMIRCGFTKKGWEQLGKSYGE